MESVPFFSKGSAADWNDDELKAMARTQRREAMELLMRKYNTRLTAHASSLLHDQQEARDVVQEVFIKAMREPRLFEPDFKIGAWLYRVTRNLCFNLSRDRRRRDHLLSTAPNVIPATPADPGHVVVDAERQDELLEAIGQLTDDHREILMLRYYEDKSYAEIATSLSIKLGTVMSRLSRARARLQDVLSGDLSLLLAS